jgi:hypothetical protein
MIIFLLPKFGSRIVAECVPCWLCPKVTLFHSVLYNLCNLYTGKAIRVTGGGDP